MTRHHERNGPLTLPTGKTRVVRKRAASLPGAQLDALLLDALARCDRPLSAYDLANELRGKRDGKAVPPIYRALDRLVARRLVQKVETLSAYRPRDKSDAVLMICVGCGRTVSLAAPTEYGALLRCVRDHGFQAYDIALEATGRCEACRLDNAGDNGF